MWQTFFSRFCALLCSSELRHNLVATLPTSDIDEAQMTGRATEVQ